MIADGRRDEKMNGERENRIDPHLEANCARCASLAIEVLLQGKWRVHILCAMRSGPVRLGQLGRLIPAASRKMLTQNLRTLEGHGIVVRRDLSERSLHVEYDFDDRAREAVRAVLDALVAWGDVELRQDTTRGISTSGSS
jgi:DNA-binding HxlR family transcriptional regulator